MVHGNGDHTKWLTALAINTYNSPTHLVTVFSGHVACGVHCIKSSPPVSENRRGTSPPRYSKGRGGDCVRDQGKTVHRGEGTEARDLQCRGLKVVQRKSEDSHWWPIERKKASRSGEAPGLGEQMCDKWGHRGEAPVTLQVAPARTPALSRSNQNKHWSNQTSTHALPAEPRTQAGSGAGKGRAWRGQRNAEERGERASVLVQLLWNSERNNNTIKAAISNQTQDTSLCCCIWSS